MRGDLRDYLGENQRAQEIYNNAGLEKWVDGAYSDLRKAILKGALFGGYDKSREWIATNVPVPNVTPGDYESKKLAVELLRRRFVMDGWVRAHVADPTPSKDSVVLVLEGLRETVFVETLELEEFMPEILRGETVPEAVQRFSQTGAAYYTSPWERVTIPPHQIRRVYQRTPDAPGGNGPPDVGG